MSIRSKVIIAFLAWFIGLLHANAQGHAGAQGKEAVLPRLFQPSSQSSLMESMQAELSKVVQKALPAVVAVRAESVAIISPTSPAAPGVVPSGIRPPGRSEIGARLPLVSSGFVVDPTGYIVCTADGAEGPGPFRVVLQGGQQVLAHKVGADRITNLALLKAQGTERLPALTFGDSESVLIGATAILISGNRGGLPGNVTIGTIGGKDRLGRIGNAPQSLLLLQFNGVVVAGEPGSPLLNVRGEVIGVLIGSPSEVEGQLMHSAATGFAIPSNLVRRVVSELRTQGKVHYPALGIRYETAPAGGVMVSYVEVNSPADRAGLKPGDIILRFDNTPTPYPVTFTKKMLEAKPGQKVLLLIHRQGKPMMIQVELGAQKTEGGKG